MLRHCNIYRLNYVIMLRHIVSPIQRNYKSQFRHLSAVLNQTASTESSGTVEGWSDGKPFESIPGPKPLPIVGNVWRFLVGRLKVKNYLDFFKILQSDYGDISIMTKQVVLPDTLYIYKPTDIEKLFRNEVLLPVREGFYSLHYYRNVMRKDIFGDIGSLLTDHGEKWYNIRSAANPILLQPRTINNYIEPLNIVASDFIERMRFLSSKNTNGEMPENFDFELNKWAFESIGVIALDKRFGCLNENINPDTEKMISYMVDIFKMTFILDYTPFSHILKKYNFPIWKRFVKYQDYFTDMTLKYLNEAEMNIQNTEVYKNKSDVEKSAFEKMLKIDKALAMVMTLDMLSAGIDTTGKITAAVLYYLAKNTWAQEKLRLELISLLPNSDSPITKEVLENAPYLKAVIKESLRLSPIAAGLVRTTTKDMVLSGYQIPSKTVIVAPLLYLCHNEEHFVKPKEFMPERFLRNTTGELSYKNTNQFINLPFGFGSRACIGKRMANLEIEIITSKIIRNYKLEWPHPDMTFGQDLFYGIKDPLKIHVKPL